jgi:hypothetical protein
MKLSYETGSYISWSVGVVAFFYELHHEAYSTFMRWSALPAIGYGLLATVLTATLLAFITKR